MIAHDVSPALSRRCFMVGAAGLAAPRKETAAAGN